MSGKQEQIKGYVETLPTDLLEITDSIYLYGSMARGDVVEDSDCDLLVAIDDCDSEKFEQLRNEIQGWHPELNCEFALYQISALRAMQAKGSLFLWHIKTEAIKIYSRGDQLKDILENLPAYDSGMDALSEYWEIMKDIYEDPSDDNRVVEYNLSIMATLIRNICIVCCYVMGSKQFGRISPVKYCALHWGDGFPINIREYEELYRYRTAINRGGEIPNQPKLEQYYNMWKRRTHQLLTLAFSLME